MILNFRRKIKLPKTKLLLGIFALMSWHFASAQQNVMTLNQEVLNRYEELLNQKEVQFHSSVKPWLASDLRKWTNVDSVQRSMDLFEKFINRKPTDTVEKKQFNIEAGLLFNLKPGYEFSETINQNTFGTSIGANVGGYFGSKFGFNVNYLTANSSYPQYLQNYIDNNSIVPGEGYAFGTSLGNHYKNASGYVFYTPSDHFNFQLGHGRNFWGDGYRSLLLSDAANDYSYFKITTTIWKLKYVVLYSNFKDVRNTDGTFWKFHNKYGTLHYLSWNLTKRLNISLFEAVIWQGKDTLNSRGFDVNYLNPVIFFRPVEYSLGSSDNSLMGLSFRLKAAKKLQIYGQLILDEFLLSEVKSGNGWWANKQGAQVGFKWFDALVDNLSLQAEFNFVRPYTYSHSSTLQNYGHFNQPLAHPMGANFLESVSILRYQNKRWSIQDKMIYAKYGEDLAGVNYGRDIYESNINRPSEHGHYIANKNPAELIHNDLKFTYMISPASNLLFEAGVVHRIQSSVSNKFTTYYIYIGLRTALYNTYHDF